MGGWGINPRLGARSLSVSLAVSPAPTWTRWEQEQRGLRGRKTEKWGQGKKSAVCLRVILFTWRRRLQQASLRG